jgi:acyl-coenzyme A thioesterase PaaI-like protein
MGLCIGMQCVQDDSLAREPERLVRLAELVTDPRWFYRFKLITAEWQFGQPPAPRFMGVVPAAKLRASALEALSSASVASVMFSISKKDSLAHSHLDVDLGKRVGEGASMRSNASARVPPEVDADTFATAWVELQHEILVTLGAVHGVIITAMSDYVMSAETWLSLTTVDGRVMHSNPDEIRSYSRRNWLLGHQYVRRPRWGTYLKPAHVEAVGGRAKILEVVQPEVTRDVGELFYVQLTAKVTEATSDAAKRRYRAFAELLAPITMPPAPPD